MSLSLPPIPMPRAHPTLILWDLVGSCNLRCPSCPMGSMRGSNPKGFITDELFCAILAKLKRDFACRQVHFYNWTEPLLHPRIAEYCRAASDAGFRVHLSSNLNQLKAAEDLLRSGIKTFRISLSGFTQETYTIGHRGGNIAKVKANMRLLADAKRMVNSATRIHVYFHKYRHNLHEIAAMESFARTLGFDFLADWAFLMPLEKLLAYADGTLPAADRDFANDHIVPPVDDALGLMQQSCASDRPCELIEQLVLDHLGRVMLCCATFDSASNVIGNYLEMDWPQIQQQRYAHSMCPRCTSRGGHVLYASLGDPTLRAAMAALAERSLLQGRDARRDSIPLPILPEPHPALAKSA